MREGAEGLTPPQGGDIAAGEAPVPWGAASEVAVREELVRRLSAYGQATVRLDGYTPFPLDYAAFRVEMERAARALPAPVAVEGEAFVYVFSATATDFTDPERESKNRRLRCELLNGLEAMVGNLALPSVDIRIESPRSHVLQGYDPAPPDTRVAIRAEGRALTFVLGRRSVEEIAWERGRGSTVLTVGVALDGGELEHFLQRARDFFQPE